MKFTMRVLDDNYYPLEEDYDPENEEILLGIGIVIEHEDYSFMDRFEVTAYLFFEGDFLVEIEWSFVEGSRFLNYLEEDATDLREFFEERVSDTIGEFIRDRSPNLQIIEDLNFHIVV